MRQVERLKRTGEATMPSIVGRDTIIDSCASFETKCNGHLVAQRGTLSSGDLARHVEYIGAQLRAAGIGTNSRVGIALPRGPGQPYSASWRAATRSWCLSIPIFQVRNYKQTLSGFVSMP